MGVEIVRKRFTVEQYHQMIELGILTDRDRVELLNGEILEIAPVGRRHAACIDRLIELLMVRLASKAIIRTQHPIRLSHDSELQPDITILRLRNESSTTRHPQLEDIVLVIEVSETTLACDREMKIPIYAQGNIPMVWLVDLNAEVVEVFQEPTAQGYLSQQRSQRGQMLMLPNFSDLAIAVDQILG